MYVPNYICITQYHILKHVFSFIHNFIPHLKFHEKLIVLWIGERVEKLRFVYVVLANDFAIWARLNVRALGVYGRTPLISSHLQIKPTMHEFFSLIQFKTLTKWLYVLELYYTRTKNVKRLSQRICFPNGTLYPVQKLGTFQNLLFDCHIDLACKLFTTAKQKNSALVNRRYSTRVGPLPCKCN